MVRAPAKKSEVICAIVEGPVTYYLERPTNMQRSTQGFLMPDCSMSHLAHNMMGRRCRAQPNGPSTTTDRSALSQTVWHLTFDCPTSHQTIGPPRSDRPSIRTQKRLLLITPSISTYLCDITLLYLWRTKAEACPHLKPNIFRHIWTWRD